MKITHRLMQIISVLITATIVYFISNYVLDTNLRDGVYPPHGDTIIIPKMENMIFASVTFLVATIGIMLPRGNKYIRIISTLFLVCAAGISVIGALSWWSPEHALLVAVFIGLALVCLVQIKLIFQADQLKRTALSKQRSQHLYMDYYFCTERPLPDKESVKIIFRLPECGDGFTEQIWAIGLGNDNYKIDSIPLHADSISRDDVIEAKDMGDTYPVFTKVIEKSGNETIRIDLDCAGGDIHGPKVIIDGLTSRGCWYAYWNEDYVSIHIPKGIGWRPIVEYLIDMEIDWHNTDPSTCDLYGDVNEFSESYTSNKNDGSIHRVTIAQKKEGVYIFVFRTKKSPSAEEDHLQDDFEIAKQCCLEGYGVPLDSWERRK